MRNVFWGIWRKKKLTSDMHKNTVFYYTNFNEISIGLITFSTYLRAMFLKKLGGRIAAYSTAHGSIIQ